MSISVKVSGAWRTVSQPAIKTGGAWRNAKAVYVRAGWRNRYPAKTIPGHYLTSVKAWAENYTSRWNLDASHPAAVVEAGKMRLTWTIDAGKLGFQGISVSNNTGAGKSITYTITCTDAPAGVPWEAIIGENPYDAAPKAIGTTVTGPGTSTVVYNPTISSGYATLGIRTTEAANGTTGHLVSSITESIASPVATEAVTVFPSPWRQAWPNAGTGTLGIVGVRKEYGTISYGAYSEMIQYTQKGEPHFLNNKFSLPFVPFYRVIGDTSLVASAKVTLRFTPKAPKSPVEHTISWEAPVGWGLYHVGYMGTDGYAKYYYAALTDAEVSALPANNYITKMWTPKEGGWFVYMPVCWDVSGVTVPMRSDVVDSSSGLDPYSGYTPFPPNRTATSALADYTVADGYSDMGNIDVVYDAITIELKNSGGTVIASWTGSLAAGNTPDSPGINPTLMKRATYTPEQELYWPAQWRTMFDKIDGLNPDYVVQFNRDIPHKGEAEWIVLTREGEPIGDFRLTLRKGYYNLIEVRGVNLQPDLIGLSIMRRIVEFGIKYGPSEYVLVKPPNQITYDVMKTWGWVPLRETMFYNQVHLAEEYEEEPDKVLVHYLPASHSYWPTLGLPNLRGFIHG